MDCRQAHECGGRPSAHIVIGVVGSFVGSVVFSLIGFHAYGLVAELIVGVVGACLFIWLGRKLF